MAREKAKVHIVYPAKLIINCIMVTAMFSEWYKVIKRDRREELTVRADEAEASLPTNRGWPRYVHAHLRKSHFGYIQYFNCK